MTPDRCPTQFAQKLSLITVAAGLSLTPIARLEAESIHLAAASSWPSFADPLGQESGVPVLPSIFDSLTSIDDFGQVAPELAVSWENSSDTTWIFRLRSGVQFSNGAPLTAQAVVDSFDLQMQPEARAFSAGEYLTEVRTVRALSDDGVEITTYRPDAALGRKLSRVPIFDTKSFKEVGRVEFSKRPVATGPYIPESWGVTGNRVVLKGISTSWRAPLEVDVVEIEVVPEATARLQYLLSGGTDIANAIDPDSIAELRLNGYGINIQPGPINLGIALHTDEAAHDALKDSRVRLALNLAINREAITQYLMLGTMGPATQFASPGVLGYDPNLEPYEYDPERAKALLATAGYEDGFKMVTSITQGEFPGDSLIFLQAAQDLKAIGVDIELRPLHSAEYRRRYQENSWGDIDARSTLISHYKLGDISLAARKMSCLDPRSYFCDQDMAELIEKSHQVMDREERRQLLLDINGRFHELAPAILLTQYAGINALSKRIKKMPGTTGEIKFAEMELYKELP